ncbi:MAG: hypothetical protein AABY15_08695 [Nanoarchaeota archaeon]
MASYIGQKRIESYSDRGDRIAVVYKNGSTETFKKELFEEIKTSSPIDANSLQDKRVFPIVKMILELMLDWDIKIEDFEYILSKTRQSVEEGLVKANEKLWGNKIHDRKFSDVDKVLKLNQNDNQGTKTGN